MPSDTSPPWNPFAAALAAHRRSIRVARRDRRGYQNSYRASSWPDAEPDAPYTVPLADQRGFRTLLLDLDCDDPAERGRQATDLAQLLDKAGIRYATATSGPDGHLHLLATFRHPVPAERMTALADALRDRAPDLDTIQLRNQATGSVRPPGSPHRNGGHSQVYGDPAEALAVLARGNPLHAFDRLLQLVAPTTPRGAGHGDDLARQLQALPRHSGQPHLPRPLRPLTEQMACLLRDGDTEGRYDSRSAVAVGLTAAMIQAGWTFQTYLGTVLDPGSEGLEHLRTERQTSGRYLPRNDVEAAARRMWQSTVKWVLAHPPKRPGVVPIAAEIAAIADAVRSTGWGGQAGPANRAVMDALLAQAAQIGGNTVGMSVRRLAIAAGLSKTTAAAAVRRLIEAGWLTLAAPAVGSKAVIYRLRLPGRTLAGHPPTPSSAEGRGAGSAVVPQAAEAQVAVLTRENRSHDLFSSDGLGRTAGYIADILQDAADDIAGISVRTGLSVATVRRHLRRMEAVGIAERHGAHWRHAGNHPRTVAAQVLSVTGVVARREQEYRDESATWAWWLADFDAERGFATERGLRRPGHATTRHRTPCPTRRFPRSHVGRRRWRDGLDEMRAGMRVVHQAE